jgi:hypothetical protein
MSQQELMPEPQSSKSSQESYQEQSQSQGRYSRSSTETYAQSYSKPQRSRTSNLPKADHPSTFEDSLPPYSYPAQDQTMFRQQPRPEQNTQWQQQEQNRQYGPAREVPTNAYQPYSQYNGQQQTPSWTQPQEHTIGSSRWVGMLLLVLVLLTSIPVVCSIGTIFIPILLFFYILPVMIAFSPIAFFILIPLFKVLGSEDHDKRWQRRQSARYDHSWWW